MHGPLQRRFTPWHALPSELLLNNDFQVPVHEVELWIVVASGVRRVTAISQQRLHTNQQ
jgi:hypothetical protein